MIRIERRSIRVVYHLQGMMIALGETMELKQRLRGSLTQSASSLYMMKFVAISVGGLFQID